MTKKDTSQKTSSISAMHLRGQIQLEMCVKSHKPYGVCYILDPLMPWHPP